MSLRAIEWALTEAQDVPPSCVSVLIGLANHADDGGRDAYPAEETLAGYARKSARSVRNDLAVLLDRGIIRRPLDQSAAAGLPANRRPVVYDLAFAPNRVHGRKSDSGRKPVTGRQLPPTDRKPASARKHATGHQLPVTGGHGGSTVQPGWKQASDKPSLNQETDDDLIHTQRNHNTREHEIDAVITALRLRTGKTVTREWAARVIEHVLGDRADIKSRLGYLTAAIRTEPKPHERFLPAPQPPPFRKDPPT
jgi:hypothetical protein